jgi:hypothetical protein
MRFTLCAGLVALAATGLVSGSITPVAATEAGFARAQTQAPVNIDLARIRSVLHLTAAQERYWPAVESALRRLSNRPGALGAVLNSAAVARLVAAARPLLGVLDDNQRQAAYGLAQEMGLGPVLAALN